MPVSVTDTLRNRLPEGVEPQPVYVPHNPTAGAVAEPGDRVKPVHRQLAQALKVRALAAEALEQEGGVGD